MGEKFTAKNEAEWWFIGLEFGGGLILLQAGSNNNGVMVVNGFLFMASVALLYLLVDSYL